MKKEIYYVIEKETRTDVYEECTGVKDIRVYEINENKFNLITTITCDNEDNSEYMILSYLSGDANEYDLINL